MRSGSHNVVSENDITANVWHGLFFVYSANNVITENNVTGNGRPGYDSHGIELDAISSGNSFYHNNIVNNDIVAKSDNIWDFGYPFGGNYWSDYRGVDNCWSENQNLNESDMIGDTYYVINQRTGKYPHYLRAMTETHYGRIFRTNWALKSFMGLSDLRSTEPYVKIDWRDYADKMLE